MKSSGIFFAFFLTCDKVFLWVHVPEPSFQVLGSSAAMRQCGYICIDFINYAWLAPNMLGTMRQLGGQVRNGNGNRGIMQMGF